jgi:hypothetical protein
LTYLNDVIVKLKINIWHDIIRIKLQDSKLLLLALNVSVTITLSECYNKSRVTAKENIYNISGTCVELTTFRKPIPVAERSKAWSASARLLGLRVRIPPRAWMFACCECCVLSGTGLCDGLITRPEESYRLWCALVCDLETSRMRKLKPASGL